MELGLKQSAKYLQQLTQAFVKDNTNLKEICEKRIPFLERLLQNELESTWFKFLSDEQAKYYQGPLLFGENVNKKFSPAATDIEEAGKCLALDRGTACVFHLMRVMEVGLKGLAAKLGIPYAPSWESYLGQIDKRITAKHKTKGINWKKDEPFYRDLLGLLIAVKISWRNPTMHVVRRYTPEEAEGVFDAVRAFMQALATKVEIKTK